MGLRSANSTSFKKGQKPTENWYRWAAARKGTKRPPFSPEWRANMSKARKGKPSNAKGKTFSTSARVRIGIAQRQRYAGDPTRHPRWISDRTQLKTGREKSYDTKYKYWMREVKSRDGWKCRMADDTCKGRLEAHHILPWAKFPELRYQINNGITLCCHHHPRTRAAEVGLSPFLQGLVAEVA